jgi:Tol biopolymer transport system component
MNADGTGQRELTTGGAPAWSPDGTRIAFNRLLRDDNPSMSFDEEVQIFVINADGTNEYQLTDIPPQQAFSYSNLPSWSPDGEYIAFRNTNGVPGPGLLPSRLYRVRPDGSGLVPIANSKGPGLAVWSPNSEQLVFVDARGGGYDFVGRLLWVVNLDGSGLVQLAGGYETDPDSPDWAPDGSRIVFSQRTGDPGDPRYPNPYLPGGIFLINSDGLVRTHLTHYGQAPSWSPNGRYIAFEIYGYEVSDDYTGRSGIFIMDQDGGELVQITDGGHSPQWRPGPGSSE